MSTKHTQFAIVSDDAMNAHRVLARNTMNGDGSSQHVAFFRSSQRGAGKTVADHGVYTVKSSSTTNASVAWWDYTDGTRQEFDGKSWLSGPAGKRIAFPGSELR